MKTPGRLWAERKARRHQSGEHVDWPPPPYSNWNWLLIIPLAALGLALVAVLLWIAIVQPR
jgi:hypothetical protein